MYNRRRYSLVAFDVIRNHFSRSGRTHLYMSCCRELENIPFHRLKCGHDHGIQETMFCVPFCILHYNLSGKHAPKHINNPFGMKSETPKE